MCVLIDIVASIARMNPSAMSCSESAMSNVVIIKQYRKDMAINDMMHNIVNLYGFFHRTPFNVSRETMLRFS